MTIRGAWPTPSCTASIRVHSQSRAFSATMMSFKCFSHCCSTSVNCIIASYCFSLSLKHFVGTKRRHETGKFSMVPCSFGTTVNANIKPASVEMADRGAPVQVWNEVPRSLAALAASLCLVAPSFSVQIILLSYTTIAKDCVNHVLSLKMCLTKCV